MSTEPPSPTLAMALAVGVGGFFGALARYAFSFIPPSRAGIPLGTLTANLLGCVLIGALKAWFDRYGGSPLVSAALTTGFLGALTTLSTFSQESHALMREESAFVGLGYVLVTVVVGISAAWASFEVARRLLSPE